MPDIHPTAIIDSAAQLAEDVVIGPHCVIDGPALIGAGTRLIGSVYLHGPVVLGERNTLYPHTCIGFEPQALWYKGETAGVAIGDDNQLREGVTIHCSGENISPTRVGNGNLLMNHAHLGHDALVANNCVFASGALVGGHVEIQDNVNVAGNAGIQQYCRLGRLCFIGGGNGVTRDVPPFVITRGQNQVFGLNVIGLRRSGVTRNAIDHLRQAYETLYLNSHSRPVAIELMEASVTEGDSDFDLVVEFVNFVKACERGLCPHIGVGHKRSDS